MKSPITRRRQRRILEALAHLGPLSEHDLYDLLGAHPRQLNHALLALATDGRITVKTNTGFCGTHRVWHIAETTNTESENA